MKKNASSIIFLLAFILLFVSELLVEYPDLFTNLNPNDYARIIAVDYTAKVVDEPFSNGKVIITERLTFDIHAASENNLFWELWRDLPEDYIDGVKVDYKVNSVKQILEDGSEIIYDESSKLYWYDSDYTDTAGGYGPGKWYHSEGPYNEDYDRYECVFFYVDGLYREKVTFEIEYEMNNAALRYNDCSELYLCMYSEETIKHLESFKGQILVPYRDMPSSGNYFAHTYGTNSNSFAFTESKTKNPGYHTFSFELDEEDLQFKPYNQYIEFSLVSYGEDKHIFTDYINHYTNDGSSINNYYDDNVLDEIIAEQENYESGPQKAKDTKTTIFVGLTIWAIWLLRSSFKTDKKLRKKHTFYKPSIEAHYFRDIPSNLDPNFAAELVFCKDKKPDDTDGYAAIMLNLVRKGYVSLDEIDPYKDSTSDNMKIVVKHKPLQTLDSVFEENIQEQEKLELLSPTEEAYFNLIIKHSNGTEISMDDFQKNVSTDYENTDAFVREIESSTVNIGIAQGYFQKAAYQMPRSELKFKASFYRTLGILLLLSNIIFYQTTLDLAYGAFFILGIAFIISSRHIKKISKNYVLLTQFGEDEYVKWRGLYNFLNSETLMSERTAIELPLWEQYLVYSTAFGISDKVTEALKIRCPDLQESAMLRNPYYRSTTFRSSSRSFRSAAHSASYTARGGSYGGHGGYGGGGRGGGGGGGGH